MSCPDFHAGIILLLVPVCPSTASTMSQLYVKVCNSFVPVCLEPGHLYLKLHTFSLCGEEEPRCLTLLFLRISCMISLGSFILVLA